MKVRLFIIFLCVALLIAFFPFLASTTFGTPFFAKILQSKVQGNVQIGKAKLSWKGPQRLENITIRSKDFEAKIPLFESPVPFWNLNHMGNVFDLQNMQIVFPAYENSQISNIQAKVQDGTIFATGTTLQGGSISVKGSYLSKTNFDITANLQELPTIAIDQLLNLNKLLINALGQTFSFNGSLRFKHTQGNLAFTIASPNCKGSVNASIQNNILTLNQPVELSLYIHEEMGRFITNHISSKVITSISAKNPFYLTILPQGFSCSINPFNWKTVQIGEGILNLGQVQVQSGKSLHFLVKLFKNKDFGKTIDAWFTPVTFSLQNNLLQLGRMDALLSQSIHICTWGDIDFAKDQLHMTLGLPSDTLEESFGIKNLSRNYVLQIPIRGPLNNPEFDSGPAVAKIATLATSAQIPTKGGKIFGGIMNVFTQAQDEGDTPPPNRPFPWER